jgi:NADPH:quinone reductase-like Zn-dependent oxidoreductase
MKTEGMLMRTTGGPDVLEWGDFEIGEPGPREVRVRVRAVAMNHLDLWTRRGLPNVKYEFPFRLGSDIAGEVEAIGPGARNAKVGQRVMVNPGWSDGTCARCLDGDDNLCAQYKIFGENTHGGYARHINVPDTNLVPISDAMSFTDAAAIPLVFITAWQMVVRRAEVKAGQTILVQAAGSGVSSAAIQICKMLGARIIATTGTDEKARRARELGADEVINYASQDFVAECKRLTGKRGVDAVIEHVGGEVFTKSILATAWGGRVVTCGATSGFKPDFDLRQIFFRQVQVLGSTMGRKSDLLRVAAFVEQGKLKPVVDRVMPLREARAAHVALENREAFGKIVLSVD